ncbi:tyrosine-type recombinase/integrase [Rhizobium skierniewicense]|uniref:tyrosine-type recombinase/integrase n=1 Tax=Rhizobium skierniewicense TaxID=984260 RepID=UPI001574CCB0|nr:site-specific integrase [Rhizobium skierniewicense]NTF35020.1 tyrosine-type recombinase/integrase [Rhizobium skierniewicense]
MESHILNDKYVGGLALAAASNERYQVNDMSLPNFFVRIGARDKTFFIHGSFGGASTKRIRIGVFGDMTTTQARLVAEQMNKMNQDGLDPTIEQKKEREREIIRKRSTFASVIEDYIAFLPTRESNKSSKDEAAFVRRHFLDRSKCEWADKPISEVTDGDVTTLVELRRAEGASNEAYKCLKTLRTIFRWCMHPHRRKNIGLQYNPIVDLTPKSLGLKQRVRKRHFDIDEIRAFLEACSATPYPYGPFSRSLIETGQRKSNVAEMEWSELNLVRKTWTIPAEKYKTDDDHIVPLSDAMTTMLQAIKDTRTEGSGKYVFSFSNGQRPITSFSRNNKKLRAKFAQSLGDIAPGRKVKRWTLHDVRRTLRTHIEGIVSRTEVAEAAVGHKKKGIEAVYNHYRYLRELRTAFNQWSQMLKEIEDDAFFEAAA